MRILAPLAATAVLSACAANADRPMVAAPATMPGAATAAIATATGAARGEARFTPTTTGMMMTVALRDMAPGIYAMHLHSVGRCEAPAFESAGPHWNPDNREHGRDNPAGAHAGDLPDVTIGADGNGTASVNLARMLRGGDTPLIDADGAAIVIHARPDDHRSDPAGNAGARIACGVIG